MKQNKLHSIKKAGFKAPKDYFDNLEDTIFDTMKLKEKVEDSGFKIPNNYFDAIEDTIINNVSKKKTPKVVNLFSKRNLVYVSGIAAALLIFFNLPSIKPQEKLDWNLDLETVENYIINEDISAYEIAALLDEEDLLEENFINHNFNDDTVDSYIIDNLDIEDIIFE